MKQYCLLLLVAVLAGSACAQNEKVISDANASIRSVPEFHAIQIGDGIDLYLTQSNEQAVAISANKEEYRNQIVTRVDNGVLKIYYKQEGGFNLSWRDRRLRAYISVKNIDEIKASGGSDIILQGSIAATKLSLELSGGSDFVGELKTTELFITMSGGSDMHIKGETTNLKVEATGGSDFKGYNLQSEYVIIEARGGSDAQLSVSKELYAEASGGSDIYYKGNPQLKRNSSGGGSSITRRD